MIMYIFQSSDPHSYKLAVSVIQRAGTSLEPYVQRVKFPAVFLLVVHAAIVCVYVCSSSIAI